jgi:hypothetical protein
VVRRRGLRPQTHHKILKAQGGDDSPNNLITLCLPCQATKLRHEFMLAEVAVDDYPQFIKWYLWETALNLLGLADAYDPRDPPSPEQLSDVITSWQRNLDGVNELVNGCKRERVGVGAIKLLETFTQELEQLEDLIVGLRVAWKSHHVQRALDAIIRHGEHA